MSDYSKGKIYAIKAPECNYIYIGSTVKTLSERMACHRATYCKLFEGGDYVSSYYILGFPDAYIQLIEEYPCATKQELRRREGEIIMKSTNCVNRCIAGLTKVESYRLAHKKYYQNNKQKRKENATKWNRANREKHNEQSRNSYHRLKKNI